MHFCAMDGVEYTWDQFVTEIFDTLVFAKIVDSDRVIEGYGLKDLAHDWCNADNEDRTRMQAYLKGMKSKNYADCPADIMGDYACGDVRKNRAVYHKILSMYDSSMKLCWENEMRLTPVIYDIEDFGMPVDNTELKVEKAKSLHKQIMMGDRLHTLLGHEMNPKSNPQVYDVLINQFGLPILATNEDEKSSTFGNPTFDKDALALYLIHPSVLADPLKLETVKLIKGLRDECHFESLFLNTYIEQAVNGILHPSYNQVVRTGRMSCRNPNAQQLNKRAKKLIHPRPGMAILSADYSQIEFRLIAHYICDQEAIKAYNEKPDTDFHSWVASMCGVKRKAAKCLNFGMGFGAGKAKVVKMLSGNPDVIEATSVKINLMIESGVLIAANRNIEYKKQCEILAEGLYNIYHERLPGIKATSRRAADVVKARGYVFNAYGRRRHLQDRFCYKAFNSVVQSCAADVMKDTTVKLAPRYNKVTRDWGYNIFALVHDDASGMGPVESILDPMFQRHLKTTLEDSTIKFSIPIVTEMGYSLRDWGEASAEEPVVVDGHVVAGPLNNSSLP